MINCTKSRGLMWVKVYDEASKTFPYSLHYDPYDAISGPREGEGEQRLHWIYVNFYTSPIIPKFEINVPGFEVTYIDDIVLPRQVGTVLLRGTPPTPGKAGEKLQISIKPNVVITTRDPDDKLSPFYNLEKVSMQ